MVFHLLHFRISKEVSATVKRLRNGRNAAGAMIRAAIFVLLFCISAGWVKPPVYASGTSLTTSLRDGYVHRGSRLSFEAIARDASGAKTGCTAMLNGEEIVPVRDDEEKTSYTVVFTREGENTITVYAGEGADRREITCRVTYVKAAPGEVIGRAVWSVEAFTVGAGYIVYPVEYPIREGENAAAELIGLLRENGLACYYGGTPDSDFYLACVADGQASSATRGGYARCASPDAPRPLDLTPSIPGMLVPYLEKSASYFDPDDYAKNSRGYLGEFVFTDGSGWMHSVNGSFPNTALSDAYLSDGDVVRVQYTLAFGADLTGAAGSGGTSRPAGFYPTANKDALTRAIAISRTSEHKRADNVRSARLDAIAVACRLDADQRSVDGAEKALLSALASPVYGKTPDTARPAAPSAETQPPETEVTEPSAGIETSAPAPSAGAASGTTAHADTTANAPQTPPSAPDPAPSADGASDTSVDATDVISVEPAEDGPSDGGVSEEKSSVPLPARETGGVTELCVSCAASALLLGAAFALRRYGSKGGAK